MIEARTPGTTPPKISVMQIDQDLKDGINKSDIAIKYSIKKWEVDEIFKHPFLKGRKPSRKKMLSFEFVDDVPALPEDYPNNEEIDPNQVTLEDAIDDAIDTIEEVKEKLKTTEEDIIEILSPTEFKTTEEFVEDLVEINDTNNNDFQTNSLDNDSLDTDEEEIKVDDNSFEL